MPGDPMLARLVRVLSAALCATACGQEDGDGAPQPIDACGTLVQGVECVLFEGGGGRYWLSDYGDYHVGDTVRVVGTILPDCVTICGEIDGCVSDARVYDVGVYPCGTDIPNLPADLIGGVCDTTAAALGGLTVAGLCFTWPGRRRR